MISFCYFTTTSLQREKKKGRIRNEKTIRKEMLQKFDFLFLVFDKSLNCKWKKESSFLFLELKKFLFLIKYDCLSFFLQEVTLQKSKSCPRLGLKLYYGTANENDTDVFIGEVDIHYFVELSLIDM